MGEHRLLQPLGMAGFAPNVLPAQAGVHGGLGTLRVGSAAIYVITFYLYWARRRRVSRC